VMRDPHHLPRWWPRVTRVEDVEGAAFTEVLATSKGKLVRADFELQLADDAARVLRWSQQVDDTPFARVLRSSVTEVKLSDATGGGGADRATLVTIALEQKLNGFLSHFGSFMVRRAAAATLDDALDGLERISA